MKKIYLKNNIIILLILLIFVILIILAGIICYNKGRLDGYVEGYLPTCPGDRCITDSGCKTPMEYLVRSSCPFTSICVDNQCKVACRWDMEENKCNKNSDCNCSSLYMVSDIINCSCIKGLCTAIVK